jgi:hypothetical protein
MHMCIRGTSTCTWSNGAHLSPDQKLPHLFVQSRGFGFYSNSERASLNRKTWTGGIPADHWLQSTQRAYCTVHVGCHHRPETKPRGAPDPDGLIRSALQSCKTNLQSLGKKEENTLQVLERVSHKATQSEFPCYKWRSKHMPRKTVYQLVWTAALCSLFNRIPQVALFIFGSNFGSGVDSSLRLEIAFSSEGPFSQGVGGVWGIILLGLDSGARTSCWAASVCCGGSLWLAGLGVVGGLRSRVLRTGRLIL